MLTQRSSSCILAYISLPFHSLLCSPYLRHEGLYVYCCWNFLFTNVSNNIVFLSKWLPLSILYNANVAFALESLKGVDIPMYIGIKRLMPLAVLALGGSFRDIDCCWSSHCCTRRFFL